MCRLLAGTGATFVPDSFNVTSTQSPPKLSSLSPTPPSPPSSIGAGALFGIIFLVVAVLAGVAFLLKNLFGQKPYVRLEEDENEFHVMKDYE